MTRQSLKDLPLKGKKVLIRVDFNVPLDKGKITDDTRIVSSLPTIRYVIEQGGYPILMSHLGRPKGKSSPEFSLAPCARRLAELLGKPVIMAPDCIGENVQKQITRLSVGESVLLENLRFHPGEEKPKEDPGFAKQLAQLGEVYINDAFGTAHREHASTFTIVPQFKGNAAAGFLMEKEIRFLGDALTKPKRPFFAVIGGAKVSSKIGVIKALVKKIDVLLIGGAMAFTFLKAKGIEIGDSLFEPEFLDTAKAILDAYESAGVKLMLPIDHVIVKDPEQENLIRFVLNEEGIPKGYQGVDIGPETIEQFSQELQHAKTVFWNGPMGIFEKKSFSKGTRALAEAIAGLKATTIVGGGDSVSAIRSMNMVHQFTHISTGGGASMEYIEYGTLPGIEAINNA
jgi:phosphoglycerate kinase